MDQHVYSPKLRMFPSPNQSQSPDGRTNAMTSQQIPYAIYRDSKYSGFLRRLNQYFIIYSRFYILQPLLLRLNQLHLYLLECLGFLIMFCFSFILIPCACVLYLIRRIRVLLVKKFHPTAIICEDLSPRCILIGKSHGIVTAIVWTHGKITRGNLRSELSPYKTPILRKKLTDKFGLRVWIDPSGEVDPSDYDISDHIIEAPSKFYQLNLTDEDSSEGQKSSLQKYVTSCASKRLSPEKPPWEIILIPQPNRSKERTCCVLRFHYLLLRDKNVRRSLGDIFTRKIDTVLPDDCDFLLDKSENCEEDPVRIIRTFVILYWCKVKLWAQNNFILTREDLQAWINLRRKELTFHSKTTLVKAKFFEFLLKIQILSNIKSFDWKELWCQVKQVCSALFLILRAISYIPIELFNCFRGPSLENNGIRRAGKTDTRQVAWSTPISSDLLAAIQEKTDVSQESILLTACSLALRDYFDETGLRNPKSLDISIPCISDDLVAPTGFKSLTLSTDTFQVVEQLNKIDSHLENYPSWKILGSYYILMNASYVLPRAIAYLVLKKLFNRYPITFTSVDLEHPLPIILPTLSLWGQPVDEFIFWRSPHSDFCVSITVVKYLGMRRLAVLSPMKSMDRALTKHFQMYLNRIAESVGVSKSRIPYSQRSSPNSSYGSSPPLSMIETSFRGRGFTRKQTA